MTGRPGVGTSNATMAGGVAIVTLAAAFAGLLLTGESVDGLGYASFVGLAIAVVLTVASLVATRTSWQLGRGLAAAALVTAVVLTFLTFTTSRSSALIFEVVACALLGLYLLGFKPRRPH